MRLGHVARARQVRHLTVHRTDYWWSCVGFPGCCGDVMARSADPGHVARDRDSHLTNRHPGLALTDDQKRLQEWPHNEGGRL